MEHRWLYLAKIRCLLIEANLRLIEVWSEAKKKKKSYLAEESSNVSRNLFSWGKSLTFLSFLSLKQI